jgi:hypothetical protein
MPITYDPIATYTLPSAASSYTFTSISQAYTDLICVIYMQPNTTNYDVRVGASNTIATTAYNSVRIFGNGTSTGTDGQDNNTTGVLGNVSNNATYPTQIIIHFQSYTSTTLGKGTIGTFSNPLQYTFYTTGLWRSASAINCLSLHSTSGQTISAGTNISLYGIARA